MSQRQRYRKFYESFCQSFVVVKESDSAGGGAAERFKLLTAADIKSQPPPQWLVEELLPKGALAVLYGPPATAKTFIVLSIALSIQAGCHWADHEVQKGPVVYVLAEGAGGMGMRIRAWERAAESVADKAWFLIDTPLFRDPEHVDDFIAAVKQLPSPPSLIVIDTFARCMAGGDENSAKDVGEFIAGIDKVRHHFNCAIVLVHHTGKRGGTERGSSALRAAADVVMVIKRRGQSLKLHAAKVKDAPEFEPISLLLKDVRIEGDRTSCAITKMLTSALRSKHEATAIEALQNFGSAGATYSEWKDATRLANTTFDRVKKTLATTNQIVKTGKTYRVAAVKCETSAAEARK